MNGIVGKNRQIFCEQVVHYGLNITFRQRIFRTPNKSVYPVVFTSASLDNADSFFKLPRDSTFKAQAV